LTDPDDEFPSIVVHSDFQDLSADELLPAMISGKIQLPAENKTKI
jgi:hypothetical protein